MVLVLVLLYFNTGSSLTRYPEISMGICWPGPAPISTDGAAVPAWLVTNQPSKNKQYGSK